MPMTVTVERYTPAKAERMLNKNGINRALRPGLVEKYATDMRNGTWTDCTDPIAFYEDDDIADGQHRLWAIVESGVTVSFITVHGLDRAAGLNIDIGLNRSLVDNARISGINPDLSNRLIAVCRAIEMGSRPNTRAVGMSNAQKLTMVDKHDAAARWAIENAPTGRAYSHGLVLAAVGRAWYHEEDKARLANFCEVLGKGFMMDDGDSAAIALRNFLMNTAASGFMHQDVWRDAFFKTQNAIKHFMRKRKLTVIRGVKEEAYPLPGDKKRKAA